MTRLAGPARLLVSAFALFAMLLATPVSATALGKGSGRDNPPVPDADKSAPPTAGGALQILRPARVDRLPLPPAEMPVKSAVTDSVHGYAYLGSTAGIVKLRLSDFTRVGSLPLPDQVGDARAAAIDENAGYAYFLATGPSHGVWLLSVRLSDFTYAGTVFLGEQTNYPLTIEVDAVRGYLYATTINRPPIREGIARVRLSDLAIQGTLSVGGEVDLSMIDPAGGYAYFCTGNKITKLDLANSEAVGSLQLHPDGWYATGSLMDAAGGYAYIIVRPYGYPRSDNTSYIVKLRLSDFTIAGSLPSLPLAGAIGPMRGSGYFITARDAAGHACDDRWSSSPCKVIRMRLSDLTESASMTLDFLPSAATWDPATGFAYLADSKIGMKRLQLYDMTLSGTVRLYPAPGPHTTAVIDPAGGYAYFGSSNSGPGLFERIDLGNFSYAGALLLEQGERSIGTAVLDPEAGYAYLGVNPSDAPGARVSLVKVRLSDFTRDATLTEPFGYGSEFGPGVIDPAGGYAYFAMAHPPFGAVSIERIRLSDFTAHGSLSLDTNIAPYTAAIDAQGGHAYFAWSDGIRRLRLSDFTFDGQLAVESGRAIRPALIDPLRGVAYFGVVRVRLSDFTRLDDLSLGCSSIGVASGAIDPTAGFAYYVVYTNDDPVTVRVKLDDPSQVTCFRLAKWLPYGYQAAVIDPDAGFMYVAADSQVLRMDLRNFPSVWLPSVAR